MPRFADHLTDVSDILGSAVASNGSVRVKVGDSSDGEGWGQGIEAWGPDGYVWRPNAASAGSAARALYLTDGPIKRVVATADVRYLSRAGTMNAGDRAIITNSPARFKIVQSTDTVELYSESSGNPVKVSVEGSGNKVTIRTGGNAKVEIVGNTATLEAAGASVSIDASGNVTVLPNIVGGVIKLGWGASAATPVAIMSGGSPVPSTKIYGVV